MNYIECPQVWDGNGPSLFLAGGITLCPDWQKQIVCTLSDTSLTLLNPRRSDFDIEDPRMEREQIKWEHVHLEKADIVSFWFPCETLCPITLFELGKYLMKNKTLLCIGVHPDYKRKRDIEIQVGLERPEIKIHSSLKDLTKEIKERVNLLI